MTCLCLLKRIILKGLEMSANLGINFLWYPAKPTSCSTSFTFWVAACPEDYLICQVMVQFPSQLQDGLNTEGG